MSRWLVNCEEVRTTMSVVDAFVAVASSMHFTDSMPGILGSDGDGNSSWKLKKVFEAMRRVKELGVTSSICLKSMIGEDACASFLKWYDGFHRDLNSKMDCHVLEVNGKVSPIVKKLSSLLTAFSDTAEQKIAESVKKLNAQLATLQKEMEEMRDSFSIQESRLDQMKPCADMQEKAHLHTVAWACRQLLSSKNVMDAKKGERA
eukprot:412730-Pyramimonas_sp.AAC.1